ncbi:MAG: acyl-CoA thioesterase [Gemmobacter sp.]
MTYTRTIAIEFNHCDPAGIVFYPRYFEMTNSLVENFCAEVLHDPFARQMAEGRAIPTVRIEIDFRAASRLGERVAFHLDVQRIGGASVTFAIRADCGGERRLEGQLTLVRLGPGGRPDRWPDDIRARLATHLRQGETA